MADFATLNDVIAMFRPLTPEETARTTTMLPVVSDSLRVEAEKRGKDLDDMVSASAAYANVVKSVTVDVVARLLMTPTNEAPMTQYSQSALGYSVSGSFLVPGGGLFIKNSELARLGLRRQIGRVIRLD